MESVWVLFSGNDDEAGTAEDFQGVYSSKSKAKKGAQEIMDGYVNPSNNWWDMTNKKDEIIWSWFYNISKKTNSGTYVRIENCKVK